VPVELVGSVVPVGSAVVAVTTVGGGSVGSAVVAVLDASVGSAVVAGSIRGSRAEPAAGVSVI